MTASSAEGAPKTGRKLNPLVRAALIAATVVAVIVILAVGLVRLTASPKLCASCHEMTSAVSTWQASAHANVGCESCHETPQAWYGLPQTLAERLSLLMRDYKAHRANPTSKPFAITAEPIPDTRCLECHDLSRTVTLRYGTLIKHAEHAKRNKSCVSCHLWTGHPTPGAQTQLLLMARCFTCHGRGAGAKAPGTCATCHPRSFNQRPETHTHADWTSVHGKSALADRQLCAMCHEPAFCRACHGLDMPHPSDWVKGTQGHAFVGKNSPQLCAKCHAGSPDLCGMCHHKSYDVAKGPWLQQHPSMVNLRGAAFCMTCHKDLFCYNCHIKRRFTNSTGAQ